LGEKGWLRRDLLRGERGEPSNPEDSPRLWPQPGTRDIAAAHTASAEIPSLRETRAVPGQSANRTGEIILL